MEGLIRESRIALRSLRLSPLFSATVVAVMALAIGFNGAVFSLVNGVLLRALPYRHPEQLVKIYSNNRERGFATNPVSRPDFVDWSDQSRSFSALAGYFVQPHVLTAEGAEPALINGASSSAAMLPLLGASPLLGRTFTPEEDRAGGPVVTVLSHAFWRSRFAGDPAIVGRRIVVDGVGTTVLGVMRPGFDFPGHVDLWSPLALDREDLGTRGGRALYVVARLRSGVTLAQAQAEMEVVAGRLARQYRESNAGWGATVVPLREDMVGSVRPFLLVLLAAVTVVVLIASANIANLLLARASARVREVALRHALGAGRLQVLLPILLESLWLALFAGLLGLFVATRGTSILVALNPDALPRAGEIAPDGWVILYTLALALMTGVAFGLAPALAALRPDFHEFLKEGVRVTAGRGRRLRSGLVICEVSLALVLLVGAGLLCNSFVRLLHRSPGFRPDHLLTAALTLSPGRFPAGPQQSAFMAQLVERASALPQVHGAAVVSHLPVSGDPGLWNNAFHVEGREPLPPGVKIRSHLRWVTPGYFSTMGIPLLAGREFGSLDAAGQPNVAIVDEEMKRQYFPHEDPLGKRLVIYFGERVPRRIVGVVATVKQAALAEAPSPHMYVPYAQSPRGYGNLVVRTTVDEGRVAAPLRALLRSLDPGAPVQLTTMDAHLAESVAEHRFDLVLIGIFAAAALVLALLGVYSVVAYGVAQRRYEIGVRLALGASPGGIVRLIVMDGVRLLAASLVIGILASLAATRVLASLLFEIRATDPLTFGAVTLLLSGVAIAATYLPARRAAKVDPLVALR